MPGPEVVHRRAGRLVLLDFGLLGRLDDDTRRQLSLLLLAIAQNRADDVADLILSLSLTTMDSDEAAFVHELRRKLPRFHWRPLSGIQAGESLAGVRDRTPKHQFQVQLRPNGANGKLMPEISAAKKAPDGSADKKVQAYNFRVCMTKLPENRVAFPKPAGYDPARYEPAGAPERYDAVVATVPNDVFAGLRTRIDS